MLAGDLDRVPSFCENQGSREFAEVVVDPKRLKTFQGQAVATH